ncbi:GGDEF domain-containing protein [Pseudoxanthomonas koreensis]|uniref:GGDEF domain-containing protein n=1 Tax=Pseudoxanthomonas koreensis TaxID=266061 RepID=UPI0035A610D5
MGITSRRVAGARRWCMHVALLLLAGAWVLPVQASPAGAQQAPRYLMAGAPATGPAPSRACEPEMLARLDQHAEVPPPPGGWPGVPQAVEVFNVFAGEVMVGHGEQAICGRLHDARTLDTRFLAGVGMVLVPPAGDMQPIRVAWAAPLQAHWVPTVRVGAPSQVHQMDTARLMVRIASLSVANALAFAALMGFLSARDRVFLGHAVLCVLVMLWQAVLSGLSGYPVPWLPVDEHASRWLLAFTCMGLSALLYVLWQLAGVRSRSHALRVYLLRALAGFWLLGAAAAAWLPLHLLGMFADGVEIAFRVASVVLFLVGVYMARQRRANALVGLLAIAPFLVMSALEIADSRYLVAFRVEMIQLSITWFLIMSAYALNLRLGSLRRQRDEMQALVDTDALTGLANRRAGRARLAAHVEHATTHGGALTVAFLDIDRFKAINDVYGHSVGDQVLVAVAQTLSAGVRDAADAARIGGEEFLMMLPGVDTAASMERMEAVRAQVPLAVARLGLPGLTATISIGVATLHPHDAGPDALLARADAAMYQAKRGGRDRVVAAGPPGAENGA